MNVHVPVQHNLAFGQRSRLIAEYSIFSVIDGRFQVQQVPWHKESDLPAPGERLAGGGRAHFPNSAWLTLSRQTFDDLQRFKTRRALPTWDATVLALLAEAADARPGAPGAQGAPERRP